MSFTVAMLKAMREEGLSLDACIRVLEAGEPNRSPAAVRQKRYRDNKRNVTRNVTPPPNERDNLTPSVSPVVSDETTHSPELKVEHVVEAWNDICAEYPTLKPVSRLTPGRRKKITTRIAEETVDDFTEAIDAIRRSPFLRGDSDRGWRATFDWMLKPENFTKLIEGNYER